jgi:phage portal protein BeeE
VIIQNETGKVVTTFSSDHPNFGSMMSPAFSGSVSLLGGMSSATYRSIYKSELWVNVCVNKLARGIARLPLKVYERTGEDRRRVRSEENDLAKLLHEPWEGGSTFDLINAMTHEYLISPNGKSLAAMLSPGPGRPPSELIPLDWRYVKAYYVHGRLLSLGFHGDSSPMAALASTVQLEDAAKRQMKSWFEGGAKMAAVITHGGKQMKADQVEAWEKQLITQHGGPDRAFRMALLGNMPDARVQTLEHSAEALQLTETRRINREEACAAFDIPPPMVGILDKASFSNIDTQNRMLAVHTFAPHTAMQETSIASPLIRQNPRWSNLFVEFDYGDLLRGNPQERAEAYQKWIQGIYTPNELRQLENLKRIEHPDADRVYMPLNLSGVGRADEGVPRATEISTAAWRLGLAIANNVLSPQEARDMLGVPELQGDPPPDPLKWTSAPGGMDVSADMSVDEKRQLLDEAMRVASANGAVNHD